MCPHIVLQRGYLTLFRLRGIPIRAHWSLPIGLLVFSGFRLAPGLWLGILALIVLHELGHALVVDRVGLANLGIHLTGFGGQCRFAGSPSPEQRAWIAWGGVLAQLPVLLVAGALALFLEAPSSAFLADLLDASLRVNAILIVINLIPLSPLDGAEAWPLFGHLYRRARRERAWKQRLGRAPEEPEAPQTLREAMKQAERDARER